MLKNIRLCSLLFSIILLHLSLPSLAMNDDQDQEVRNRMTRKIAKYEIKINDLRRLLEIFHINEGNETPSPTTSPREVVIDLPVPTTPPHVPLQILHPVTPQEITPDQIREHISLMCSRGTTYEDIGVILGYSPDKKQGTPDGKSTGKAAVSKFMSGRNSPSFRNKFREKVRTGAILFSPLVDRRPEREDGRDASTQRQPATPITPTAAPIASSSTQCDEDDPFIIRRRTNS